MFFSVQHLVGSDAKFALIWRAATSGSTRKLPRRAILSISVPNICREILNFIPEGAYSDGEASSKFSLYLLGQLLYGTVLIYDRQLTLLQKHVRWAYENCKRLRMEGSLPQRYKGAPSSAIKGARRSAVVEEPRIDIDVTEQPERRFVGLARLSEITMTESQPVIWKREDLFQDEAVQAPVQISKERFIDWNEQRSSNSKDSLKTALVVKKEPATVEAASVTEELPPFPPLEVFQNMDRESFLAVTQPTFDAGGEERRESITNERSLVDAQPPSENEPLLKRPTLDNGRLLSSSGESEESTNPSLELPSLDENLEIVQPSPRTRRKPLQSIDTNGTTTPLMSMKEMQMDYSSLVKTVDELRSGIPVAVDRHPSLHELLLPYPAYAGKKFPKECIGLYRSRFCDKMTFKQAITENLHEPINRGDASILWHYSSTDQSSKESSEQQRTPGIAYALYDTPERVRAAGSGHEDTSDRRYSHDQFPVHLTPGSFKLLKTPGRELPLAEVNQGDVARPRDSDIGRGDAAHSTDSRTSLGDLSLLANTGEASQLAADATLQESGLRKESRSSYLEQARRLTGWTDESGRPSSVQLRDSSQGGKVTQLRDTSEKLRSLSSSDSWTITSVEELLVRRVRETNKFVPLSSIIPTATTLKRRAAAVFSTLLNLIRKSSVEARQMEPYGEIWIRNHSVRSSSDFDFDALASTSQPFQLYC
ncbi:unnamed protein product [Cylicocyclus nassatus]|uniref:Rad21/Rec8-like protein N-terminal domain-containing protein n=1 Tax=Cylicocyclus nassatus TaxID=53992 RepID=A0AA36MH51_CYLNA|nr:unnamed protein product [Cylicocyclus nassatus]